MDQARQEAQYLIRHGLLWVYAMDGGALSTIVAVTRSSSQVAAITKVYTAPQFRRRGCADRLVSHVCEQSVHSHLSTVPSNSNRLCPLPLPGNSKPASRTSFSLWAILSVLHVSITASGLSASAPPKASVVCKIPTWNGGWRSVSRARALATGDLFLVPFAPSWTFSFPSFIYLYLASRSLHVTLLLPPSSASPTRLAGRCLIVIALRTRFPSSTCS
jgi:predicted GNAT family acetyltransferase